MSGSKAASGFAEKAAAFAPAATEKPVSVAPVRATLGEGGRLVIPAEMRKAMGVKPGDTLIVKVVDGELTAVSQLGSIRRIQRRLAPYKDAGESADGFLADRRDEQRRSDERFDRLHDEGIASKR